MTDDLPPLLELWTLEDVQRYLRRSSLEETLDLLNSRIQPRYLDLDGVALVVASDVAGWVHENLMRDYQPQKALPPAQKPSEPTEPLPDSQDGETEDLLADATPAHQNGSRSPADLCAQKLHEWGMNQAAVLGAPLVQEGWDEEDLDLIRGQAERQYGSSWVGELQSVFLDIARRRDTLANIRASQGRGA